MIFVEPFVKKIEMSEPYKKIEYAGKICYKAQENITETSCDKFVKNIVDRNHTSVLEHESFSVLMSETKFYRNKELFNLDGNMFFSISLVDSEKGFLITANIRAWKNLEKDLLVYCPYILYLLNLKYSLIFECPKIEIEELDKSVYEISEVNEEFIKNCGLSSSRVKYHLTATFHIRTDRAVTHQIVRHRMSSFSQESQRYCLYFNGRLGDDIKFIIPYDVRKQKSSVLEIFGNACAASENQYRQLIKLGLKPETARSVLPNATATEIITTSNLKQWDRFFKLRCDEHAQKDIREIAFMIREQLYEEKYDKDF